MQKQKESQSETVIKNLRGYPVIGSMKVKDDKEAIELMKDTEYGLTTSVYSFDKIVQKIFCNE